MSFIHLHNHSDYSMLDGASKVADMAKEAVRQGMPAIALTDHGNMFGAVDFYEAAEKEGVKPLIGCELYMTDGDHKQKGKDVYGKKKPIYHLLMIAKDDTGWHNLMKLSTAGYLEGFYHKPRIDYDLLEKHHEGLIVLSGCLQSHINQTLLKKDEKQARELIGWYRDVFKDDFYLELQNHGIEDEMTFNRNHIKVAKDMGIKVVATNDSHYLKKEHADPHDVLLCVQTQKLLSEKERFKFTGNEYYLKTEDEMRELFKEVPEALTNTLEIAEKVDLKLDFNQKHFPEFTLPPEVNAKDDFEYLSQLCEEGLPVRYDVVTDEIRERLKFELDIIQLKHLASYFLIVRDFIVFARDEGIPVGPGRGSAAGSVVSYLIGITNIDPIRYNLLFERFINPERESYPDIDVDFADSRRCEVIEYVRKKYGEDCVSQIITFGRMLSKGVIRDVGRVMGIPLPEVDAIAKMIPDAIQGKTPKLKDVMETEKELVDLVNSRSEYKELMEKALVLEGTIRNAGMHAAGVVVTPEPTSNFVPLFKVKDGSIVTQFDMAHVEKLGLLKVDFLGLSTLTIIEHALELIKKRGEKIDIDNIPLDDKATYELFARGDTIGIFQFESEGMQKNLKKLIPERLEDLIAMNALYRPGPMDNIDDFVKRKHGEQQIKYLHKSLAQILDETYGIIVYQEQVMQIASKIGGMSLGRADLLRRAMGKKKLKLMNEMMPEFIAGCKVTGLTEKTAKKLWALIEKFASYGFNKSHAAAYTLVAYQTGYLKTHYPAEFMAATMTTRKDKTEELVLFLEECRNMGITVLAPHINRSEEDFSVDEKGNVIFGLTAIKGVGSGAIQNILGERDVEGDFKNIFDLTARINSRLVNKKVLENLVLAGAMDDLVGHRAQMIACLEQACAYGQQAQKEKMNGQVNIFGGEESEVSLPTPELPNVPEMTGRELLSNERDRLGLYFSGHPLLKYKREVDSLSSMSLRDLNNGSDNQKIRIVGMLNGMERKQTRRGDYMGRGRVEDLSGSANVIIFPKTYENIREKIEEDTPLLIFGRLQKREDSAEIIVEDMELLQTASSRMIRGIKLLIDEDVNGQAVIGLEEQFRNNPGRATVRIVFRTADGQMFPMACKRYNISPKRELLDYAEELLGKEKVKLEMVS